MHLPLSISNRILDQLSFSRRKVLSLLILLILSRESVSQDISLFTQKISNAFLFNPSVAGLGSAKAILSHRNNYTGVTGAPNNNYLSLHTPFSNGRFGVGLNLMQEKSSLLKTTYISSAVAYHLQLSKAASLSAGLSADLNSLRLGDDLLNYAEGDVTLNQFKTGLIIPDLSFGTTLRTRYLRMSAALNHLRTSWNETGAVNQFSRYVTGSVAGLIPMTDGTSYLEPYFNYRRYFNINEIYDVGIYYTINQVLMVGIGARNFSLATASMGITLKQGFFIGYSREQLLGQNGHYLGSTNELVIRLGKPNENLYDSKGMKQMKTNDDRKLMYKIKRNRTLKPYYQRMNKARRF